MSLENWDFAVYQLGDAWIVRGYFTGKARRFRRDYGPYETEMDAFREMHYLKRRWRFVHVADISHDETPSRVDPPDPNRLGSPTAPNSSEIPGWEAPVPIAQTKMAPKHMVTVELFTEDGQYFGPDRAEDKDGSSMDWFTSLTGFPESESDVRRHLSYKAPILRCSANHRSYVAGDFETPSLGDLRTRVTGQPAGGSNTLREVVADVRSLHIDPDNEGAFFQVASQFNTLEMVGPSVTPEQGVTGYEHDRTQGPVCAIACGAGTVVRNWLVELEGGIGQSEDRQINNLAEMATALDESIEMQNGYALPSSEQLDRIADRLAASSEEERDALRAELRIGMQWDTQVTEANTGHTVTQAYCSALPVSYGVNGNWEPFARLVLEASYEATLASARINAGRTGNPAVYLTLVGGGVFGNESDWILDAIQRAANTHRDAGLDIAVVSYGRENPALSSLMI